MREAMYGWMTRHLKGAGRRRARSRNRRHATEDPETLRCFPGQSRPDDFVTIPQFAAAEARRLLQDRSAAQGRPAMADATNGDPGRLDEVPLRRDPCPRRGSQCSRRRRADDQTGSIVFQPEPGLTLTARQQPPAPPAQKLAVVLDLDAGQQAGDGPLAAALRDGGWSVLTLDLRATGKLAQPNDRIGRAPDHNTAEWSLWLGRPLLGQWVVDVRRLLDAVQERDGRLPGEILVAGVGPAGVVALGAAATRLADHLRGHGRDAGQLRHRPNRIRASDWASWRRASCGKPAISPSWPP